MRIETRPVAFAGTAATWTAYAVEPVAGAMPGRPRPAVVICPGGGYGHLATREAEPMALAFVARGYQAFVLRYSVEPARYPQALCELAACVAEVRRMADTWGVDPRRVAVMGFSAGGHLAATLGASWHEPWLAERTGATADELRPDALVLGYPVITSGAYAHRPSFERLCGQDDQLIEQLSIERRVDGRFPATFVWHTAADATVSVHNTLLLAGALAEAQVPFAAHVFPYGSHGAALGTYETALAGREDHIQQQVQAWPDLAQLWLSELWERRDEREEVDAR